MANNYLDGTGTLHLSAVTPVIKAIFGAIISEEEAEDGVVCLVQSSESAELSEGQIMSDLADLLSAKVGEPNIDIEDLEYFLTRLYRAFGKEPNSTCAALTELHGDSTPDLETLFDLATDLDDGHGLTALDFEFSMNCTKMLHGQFGGYGQFVGRHFTTSSASSQALLLGSEVDALLAKGQTAPAAEAIAKHIRDSLLGGFVDAASREEVLQIIRKTL